MLSVWRQSVCATMFAAMLKFLTKRALLSVITLAILSVIVFLAGQLLPGDVGRAVLGPLADARSVAAFNHQAGVDRALPVQYWDLSLIHISEPTRQAEISYAVF